MDKNWLERVQYGNFSLPQFCNDAAALAKYLIRAREKFEPRFLGDKSAYDSWKLSNIGDDDREPEDLLHMVRVLVGVIDAHMVSMGGSGGVRPGDPLADFKFDIRDLVSSSALEDAIHTLRAGKKIPWESLAEWGQLPAVRSELDHLYSVLDPSAKTTPPPQSPPVAESRRVKLFSQDSVPVALIDQEGVETLTGAQYDVVKALLDAGERGLSKRKLENESGHSDACNILKRLFNADERWSRVGRLAGGAWKGYRIC